MKTHQLMTLFDAPIGTYYPAPNKTGGTFWGASTNINDWTFGDGAGGVESEVFAVLRAIHVPITDAATNVKITIRDGDGTRVMFWQQNQVGSQGILLGPDGTKVKRGFSIQVENLNGAYLMITYDKE